MYQTVIEGLSFLSSTLQSLKFKGSGIPDWESSAIPDPWFHPGQFFCTSASFATSEMFHRNRIFAVTRIHIRYRIKNRRILIIRLQFGKSQLLGIGRGNEHDIIQTSWPDLEQNPWWIILINIFLFWDFIRFQNVQLHGYVNHRCCKYRNVRLWYMCYYSISACRWARIDKAGDLYMMIICRKLSKKIDNFYNVCPPLNFRMKDFRFTNSYLHFFIVVLSFYFLGEKYLRIYH